MQVQHIDNNARIIPSGVYQPFTTYAAAFVQQARGVFWDRVAWAWRAQDGNGQQSTHPTWSEAQAALDAMAGPFAAEVTITWTDGGDLLDSDRALRRLARHIRDSNAPRKARKKGKRK